MPVCARMRMLRVLAQRHLPRDVRLAEARPDAPPASIAFDGMRLAWDQVSSYLSLVAALRSYAFAPQMPHASALVPLIAMLLAEPEASDDEDDGPAAAPAQPQD